MGCHFLLQRMKVKSESEVTQSCPTLCDPMDCSLPGSSVHGIFQARVLEWVAIAFSAKPATDSLNSHQQSLLCCFLYFFLALGTIYIYTHTHIYTYIYIHIHIYIHMHTYTYICTHIHVHVCIYTYTCMYVHTCVHMHIHILSTTYIYIYICIYICTHILSNYLSSILD